MIDNKAFSFLPETMRVGGSFLVLCSAVLLSMAMLEVGRLGRGTPSHLSNGIKSERPLPLRTGKKKCQITLVTAYFRIPSKRSESYYRSWMNNFLSLDACIVIYTDLAAESILKVRAGKKTIVHQAVFSSLVPKFCPYGNRSLLFWKLQHLQDPEGHLHRAHYVYQMWGMKTSLLKDVITGNPFDSQAFFWLDIGYFRDDGFNGLSPRKLRTTELTKFYMMEVREFDTPNRDWLAGGVFGGSPEKSLQFHDAYRQAMDGMLAKGEFIGKDQSVFNRVCLEYQDLCTVVRVERFNGVVWFAFAAFLFPRDSDDIHVTVVPLNKRTSKWRLMNSIAP